MRPLLTAPTYGPMTVHAPAARVAARSVEAQHAVAGVPARAAREQARAGAARASWVIRPVS